MSFDNPTPVQLGMTGTFTGKTYRVMGRVVLGEQEAGTVYYWNEYNLQTDAGESATLVYEVTERGPEWRWFELFEPQFPMTAEDAATKRVGDPLNLDGTDVRITFRQTSRIYHVEGAAPEGEHVDSMADYFNAESGNVMQVVSWTGSEVEFYRGLTVAASMVAVAFDLPIEKFKPVFWVREGPPASHYAAKAAVIGVFAIIFVFATYSSCAPPRRPPALVHFTAPAAPLKIGNAGKLNEVSYRVAGHALEEISEVGRRFERHAFYLHNDDGNEALLFYGWTPGAKDWALFTPLHPQVPVTPQKAAAVQWKQTINVEGVIVPVTELFLYTIRQTEGSTQGDLKSGNTLYGFSGQNGSTLLLATWNEQAVEFYRGELVPANAVTEAFSGMRR